MEVVTGTLLLLVATTIFLLWRTTLKSSKAKKPLPPGPKGLPLIGNMHSIPERDYLKYEEYKQTYGDLVFLRLGPTNTLLLNSHRAMKEALVTQADVFSVRFHSEYIDKIFLDGGIVLTDGPVWQHHRRFNLRQLREFGAGKDISEKAALTEAEYIIDQIKCEDPVNMAPVFTNAANNVIGQLTFGYRTGTEDPKFEEFQKKLNSINQDRSIVSFVPIFFPFLLRIPFFSTVFEYFVGLRYVIQEAHEYVYSKMREHEAILKQANVDLDEQEPSDICDALLIEQARQKKEKDENVFTDVQIMRDLEDLFLAGTDTTSLNMTWAMFLMAIHPEVQEKAHNEIREVIGSERNPTMKDRVQLPYVAAVIEEILRYATIIPAGVAHGCREDTELMGYYIPKDTVVMTNMWSIHRDPTLWEKPNEFHPGHFLSSDGKFKPSEHMVIFSMGRRACLGEGLARIEIFLFFTVIFQRMRVRLADPDIDLEKTMLGMGGGARRLLPHEVIFTIR